MATVMESHDAFSSPDEMVPAILVQSCVDVLGVAGAGISMTGELRVPLAASNDLAVRAERLQTTLGEGPCLTATAAGVPLIANEQALATRWPMFSRELHSQTPFRSIASLPLRDLDQQGLAALDLYSTDPNAFNTAWLAQISRDVGDPTAALLFDRPVRELIDSAGPNLTNVSNRVQIWVAVGMVMERVNLVNADALAALRAYAFSHEATLEDVAEQITSGRLPPGSLLA